MTREGNQIISSKKPEKNIALFIVALARELFGAHSNFYVSKNSEIHNEKCSGRDKEKKMGLLVHCVLALGCYFYWFWMERSFNLAIQSNNMPEMCYWVKKLRKHSLKKYVWAVMKRFLNPNFLPKTKLYNTLKIH